MAGLVERRRGADSLETEHGISERRNCQVVGVPRSTNRHPSGQIEKAALARPAHKRTKGYSRLGYRKIHGILRSKGTAIKWDRTRMIRKREGREIAPSLKVATAG